MVEEIHAIGLVNTDWHHPKEFVYKPGALKDDEIEIQVLACAICGADTHRVQNDWGLKYLPLAVGHEVVGIVTEKGKSVSDIKVGDRVGVGAQCRCCHECYACSVHKENNCRHVTGTYGTPDGKGSGTQGGYAKYIRSSAEFAFKIPDNLKTEYAAPMMCGGITGFKPLLTGGVTKGSKVGVVGIGGIGHMTVLFAKALGAEVTAISRSDRKKELAKQLGADHFIATNSADFPDKYRDSLDVIVNTASTFGGENLEHVLNLLRPEGKFISVTVGPGGEKLSVDPMTIIMSNLSVHGSAVGTLKDIRYMLDFAAEHDIKPWVECIDINEENVATAWERMIAGDVKFRFVFTGYDKFFGEIVTAVYNTLCGCP